MIIVPTNSDPRHKIISHILSFSHDVCAIPTESTGVAFLPKTNTMFLNGKPMDFAYRLIDEVVKDVVRPFHFKEYANHFLLRLRQCTDPYDNPFLETKENTKILPQFCPHKVAKELLRDCRTYSVENTDHDALFHAFELYTSNDYQLVNEFTEMWHIDKNLNSYLDEPVYISESNDHLLTIAEEIIKRKEWNITAQELKEILLQRPMWAIKKCFDKDFSLDNLNNDWWSHNKHDFVKRNLYNKNAFIVNLEHILFEEFDSSMEYYHFICDYFQIIPNVERYKTFIETLQVGKHTDRLETLKHILYADKPTDWRWKIIETKKERIL